MTHNLHLRLTIAFWGTNSPATPAGPRQGFPPLPSHREFAINLADTFDIHAADQSGGWSFDKNPTLFAAGGPAFTVTRLQASFGALPDYLAVPEPATILLFGAGLAALLCVTARRRPRGAGPSPESRS